MCSSSPPDLLYFLPMSCLFSYAFLALFFSCLASPKLSYYFQHLLNGITWGPQQKCPLFHAQLLLPTISYLHHCPTPTQALLEDKNDQHGRNSTLLSYVSYQSTLPHPDDSPPTPVGPQHPQHPPPPSSVPTHRKYSRCVWEKEGVSRWVSDCVLRGKVSVRENMCEFVCESVFVSVWEKVWVSERGVTCICLVL